MSQFIRNKNYNEKLSKKKRAYAEKLSVSHTLLSRLEKHHSSDLSPSERLATLGIMRAQLRAPLKPPIHHSTLSYWGVLWGPWIAPPLCREAPGPRMLVFAAAIVSWRIYTCIYIYIHTYICMYMLCNYKCGLPYIFFFYKNQTHKNLMAVIYYHSFYI